MRRVIEYLRYEGQCRELAIKQIKPDDRRALEWMAKTWANLAEARQHRLQKEAQENW
jgi:hypothetical protein